MITGEKIDQNAHPSGERGAADMPRYQGPRPAPVGRQRSRCGYPFAASPLPLVDVIRYLDQIPVRIAEINGLHLTGRPGSRHGTFQDIDALSL
jgi:hypothetical protein